LFSVLTNCFAHYCGQFLTNCYLSFSIKLWLTCAKYTYMCQFD